MLTLRGRFVSVTVLLVMTALVPSAQSRVQDLDIKAPDGISLRATYFSPGKPGPAVLLLHQCNMTRHGWDDLASDLSNSGIHVLAFDYRGYGDSTGTLPPAPPTPPPAAGTNRKFGPTTSGGWVANRDVELAFRYLRAQHGVDPKHLAVGGASCGAQFAADLATRHPEMRALLLMSGRISAGAAAHIATASWLSVFGVAAQGDMPIAYEGLQQAIATSKNPNSMMKMSPGHEHGVEMFAKNLGLRPLIVEWLQARLR